MTILLFLSLFDSRWLLFLHWHAVIYFKYMSWFNVSLLQLQPNLSFVTNNSHKALKIIYADASVAWRANKLYHGSRVVNCPTQQQTRIIAACGASSLSCTFRILRLCNFDKHATKTAPHPHITQVRKRSLGQSCWIRPSTNEPPSPQPFAPPGSIYPPHVWSPAEATEVCQLILKYNHICLILQTPTFSFIL